MPDCMMTHSVYGCDKRAKWKGRIPLKKGREEKFHYYCDRHKKEGVAYGWLNEIELIEI